MSSPIMQWFNAEIYPWRTAAATCWAILVVPIISFAFALLTSFSISQPLVWISESFGLLFTLKFITSVLVVAFLVAVEAYFSLPHFSVIANVEKTRLNSVLSLFQWSRLPFLIVCMVTGALSSWSLLRLMGTEMHSLTYVLDTKEFRKTVLNERHLFLVEAGVFFSLVYFAMFFLSKQNYFAFPHIQRHKFFHIRREAGRLLNLNAQSSVKNTLYFYLLYFLFGGGPKLWIKNSFGIDKDSSIASLNSVFGLLDVGLFLQTYLLCLSLLMTWSLSAALLRVYHTQLLTFEIQNILEAKQEKGLANAMACSQPQLLQHLAFYDFCSLCEHSKERRQELFSLSQPGGHPRVWMAVSRTALHVVRELTLKIQDSNRLVMSQVALTGQNQMPPDETSFLHYSNAEITGVNSKDLSNGHIETKASAPVSKLKQLMSTIPFVTQLTVENPDSNSRLLFASCQMHYWAVKGLSQVACWAYTEDKYGVVQGMLPSLIYSLVDLNEAIEKHFKCTSALRKPHSAYEDTPDALLPHRLHSVTRTAIYQLINTYRQHLADLHLSADYMKKIQMFNDFLL